MQKQGVDQDPILATIRIAHKRDVGGSALKTEDFTVASVHARLLKFGWQADMFTDAPQGNDDIERRAIAIFNLVNEPNFKLQDLIEPFHLVVTDTQLALDPIAVRTKVRALTVFDASLDTPKCLGIVVGIVAFGGEVEHLETILNHEMKHVKDVVSLHNDPYLRDLKDFLKTQTLAYTDPRDNSFVTKNLAQEPEALAWGAAADCAQYAPFFEIIALTNDLSIENMTNVPISYKYILESGNLEQLTALTSALVQRIRREEVITGGLDFTLGYLRTRPGLPQVIDAPLLGRGSPTYNKARKLLSDRIRLLQEQFQEYKLREDVSRSEFHSNLHIANLPE